jgi:hypothetical protein
MLSADDGPRGTRALSRPHDRLVHGVSEARSASLASLGLDENRPPFWRECGLGLVRSSSKCERADDEADDETQAKGLPSI